ncbi:MAG: hypothetical protein Q7J29_07420 [Stagnimonas sp.]|nr:hypothetical protein [Stagnimonas sp.]
MSLYAAFEWIVVALLLLVSLRVVWQRLVKPALQKPKAAACGSGCNGCAPRK